MEQAIKANGLPSSPGAALFIAHKQDAPAPEEQYRGLLHKIAGHFGFDEREASELVEKAYSYISHHKTEAGNELPLRVWLAKTLVRQCVFTISSELFCQSGCHAEKDRPSSLYYYYRYRNAGELHLHQMPLSFRAVYILSHCMGFTERETAEILNTTTLKVKERYARAKAFLAAHRHQPL